MTLVQVSYVWSRYFDQILTYRYLCVRILTGLIYVCVWGAVSPASLGTCLRVWFLRITIMFSCWFVYVCKCLRVTLGEVDEMASVILCTDTGV